MLSKSEKLAVQTVQTMPVVQSVFVFFRERSRSGCYNLVGKHPFITSAKDCVGRRAGGWIGECKKVQFYASSAKRVCVLS